MAIGLGVPLRRKKLPGETDKDYRERLRREDRMAEERIADPSNGPDGRKMPVRYE